MAPTLDQLRTLLHRITTLRSYIAVMRDFRDTLAQESLRYQSTIATLDEEIASEQRILMALTRRGE